MSFSAMMMVEVEENVIHPVFCCPIISVGPAGWTLYLFFCITMVFAGILFFFFRKDMGGNLGTAKHNGITSHYTVE